jgi:hypothetical protein
MRAYVKQAAIGESTSLMGSHVVGFSCSSSPSETICYIAAQ